MGLLHGNYRLEKEQMSLIKLMELKAKNMGDDVISLSQGIPWYDMPESLKKSLSDFTNFSKAKDYTLSQGVLSFREKLSKLYNSKYNCNFSSEEVLISTGAIEAISSLLLTVTTKNTDEVIMLEPTYSSYTNIIKIAGAKKVSVKLDDKFKIDFNALKSAITEDTRAIVLVNPNNPTGSKIELKQVEKILRLLYGTNIYLVTDEVYNQFIFNSDENFSHLKLFDKYKENLVVINSWSKSFGITGWRIGYMIANKSLIKQVLKIHDSLVTCAPSHSQYAVMDNLEEIFDYGENIKKELILRRDFVVEKLNNMKEFIDFDIPNGSYYIFPRFKYTDKDYTECMKILDRVKLSLVPGSSFGEGGRGHFRICYGRDMKSIEIGMERLNKYFQKKDK